MDKQFTVKDLERAADRGSVLGQISIVEDVIKQARSNAVGYFEAGNDEAAKSLREFAAHMSDLLDILNKKLAGMKSKSRTAQIADTVIDAGLEVTVE